MTIYQRYFRVTGGPLLDKAREIEADNERNRKIAMAFADEIGAKNMYSYRDGRISGFEFDKTPDQSIWKQPNSFGHYMPRKNTAEGKAMLKRIDGMPRVLNIGVALKEIGLEDRVPVLIDSRKGYFPTLAGSVGIGVLFVIVPWRDISALEIDQYKRDRESCHTWSLSLDHLCWSPTPEMQEIKRWEMEKEIDELNARLRSDSKSKAGVAS